MTAPEAETNTPAQKLARFAAFASGLSAPAQCEIVLIGIASIAAVGSSFMLAPGLEGLLGARVAVTMIAIAAIDFRRFIIPDQLTALGLVLGLIHAALQEPRMAVEEMLIAVLRGALLAAVFLAVRAIYGWIRGREGVGLGDIKLAGVGGVWLDWTMMPICIEIAALSGLTIYVLRQLRSRRAVSRIARLPFGSFLAPAIWLCWALQLI